MKLKHKYILLLLIVVVFAIGFGIYNLIWFRYVSNVFDPFFDSAVLQSIPEDRYEIQRDLTPSDIHLFHDYCEERETGFMYVIYMPDYLRFNGGIQMVSTSNSNMVDGLPIYTDEVYLNLIISPKDWTYSLGLGDYVKSNETGDAVRVLIMRVDKYSTPLPEDSLSIGANPANFNDWFYLYDKYNVQIKNMFDTLHYVFGDAIKES